MLAVAAQEAQQRLQARQASFAAEAYVDISKQAGLQAQHSQLLAGQRGAAEPAARERSGEWTIRVQWSGGGGSGDGGGRVWSYATAGAGSHPYRFALTHLSASGTAARTRSSTSGGRESRLGGACTAWRLLGGMLVAREADQATDRAWSLSRAGVCESCRRLGGSLEGRVQGCGTADCCV